MSYKVKSLLYFVCFLASAYMYNNIMENNLNLEHNTGNVELVNANMDNNLVQVLEQKSIHK